MSGMKNLQLKMKKAKNTQNPDKIRHNIYLSKKNLQLKMTKAINIQNPDK